MIFKVHSINTVQSQGAERFAIYNKNGDKILLHSTRHSYKISHVSSDSFLMKNKKLKPPKYLRTGDL